MLAKEKKTNTHGLAEGFSRRECVRSWFLLLPLLFCLPTEKERIHNRCLLFFRTKTAAQRLTTSVVRGAWIHLLCFAAKILYGFTHPSILLAHRFSKVARVCYGNDPFISALHNWTSETTRNRRRRLDCFQRQRHQRFSASKRNPLDKNVYLPGNDKDTLGIGLVLFFFYALLFSLLPPLVTLLLAPKGNNACARHGLHRGDGRDRSFPLCFGHDKALQSGGINRGRKQRDASSEWEQWNVVSFMLFKAAARIDREVSSLHSARNIRIKCSKGPMTPPPSTLLSSSRWA